MFSYCGRPVKCYDGSGGGGGGITKGTTVYNNQKFTFQKIEYKGRQRRPR